MQTHIRAKSGECLVCFSGWGGCGERSLGFRVQVLGLGVGFRVRVQGFKAAASF